MTTVKITRIGVLSLAAFTGTITWAITILTWWPVLIFEGIVPGAGLTVYLVAVLVSLVWGLVVGVIAALIYNLVAVVMGGVVIEIEELT